MRDILNFRRKQTKVMHNQGLFYLIIISVFMSCSKHKSSIAILPDSICINIKADLMIIQEENRVLREDSTTLQHKIDSLFHHYNISESQIETSVQEYKKDLTRWKEFNSKILKRLEYLQQKELLNQHQ